MGRGTRASRTCESTAHFLPTAKWPRLERFKEHTIELPVADLIVKPRNEAGCAMRSRPRSIIGTASSRSRGHSAVERRDRRRCMDRADSSERVFSTKRACPSCGTQFPEPDPRLFSFNSKHGWCAGCFGTGLKLTRLRRGAKRRGSLVERVVRR